MTTGLISGMDLMPLGTVFQDGDTFFMGFCVRCKRPRLQAIPPEWFGAVYTHKPDYVLPAALFRPRKPEQMPNMCPMTTGWKACTAPAE